MKCFTFIISSLVLFSTSFAASLSLDATSPYFGGVLTIKSNSYDTLSFSNGITLIFFNQTTTIPEPVKLNHGLIIDHNANIVKSGFRFLKNAIWEKSNSEDSLKFYKSSDTIFALSYLFPDSLQGPDSLFDPSYLPTVRTGKGKWLYYTDGDLNMYTSWSIPIENFKTILFIQSKFNKMKIQISDIFINPYPPLPLQNKVDSLRILWAVDSLGNGKFDLTASIKNKNISKPATHRNFRLNSIESIINSNSEAVFFSPTGKRVRPSTVMRSGCNPSGVFLYRVAALGKGNCLGRVLLLK
jgi:hypothetical protein